MSDFIMGLAGVIQKEISLLSTVAQNAANANTVGYKSIQSFPAMIGIDAAGNRTDNPTGNSANKPEDRLQDLGSRQHVQQADGALKYTGKPTDIALSGNAWFVLDTPQGPRLTRDGRFRLAEDGALTSLKGWPVVGEGGPLRLSSPTFTVTREGVVQSAGADIGRLVLVSAGSAAHIRLAEEGLYKVEGAITAATGHVVHQGMLEQSNVNLSTDMVRLMETTRHIESVQRALTAYDNVLSTGIGQIGKD